MIQAYFSFVARICICWSRQIIERKWVGYVTLTRDSLHDSCISCRGRGGCIVDHESMNRMSIQSS
jgi:hypothetical protein